MFLWSNPGLEELSIDDANTNTNNDSDAGWQHSSWIHKLIGIHCKTDKNNTVHFSDIFSNQSDQSYFISSEWQLFRHDIILLAWIKIYTLKKMIGFIKFGRNLILNW